MNPPINRATVLAKAVLLLSVICLVSIFLINGALRVSTAQSEERVLEDTIPKHLPIKVKIKKEKEQAFKDLKNEKWFRDLEIEVTNTGSKPIYYLAIVLEMPEITYDAGRVLGYPLIFGRGELVDLTAKVLSEDTPLGPGETYTFKIPDKWAKGFEHVKARDNKPDPKRLQIRFQVINFGDGTGFIGTDGIAVPQPKKSCLEEKIPRDNEQRASTLSELSRSSFTNLNHSMQESPASFLQVNFSLAPDNVMSKAVTPQTCCPGTPASCYHEKPLRENCQCGEILTVQSAACTDSSGVCNIPHRIAFNAMMDQVAS